MSTWDQVCHKDISYRNQEWLVRFQASVVGISCERHVCDLLGRAMIFYNFFSVNNEQPMCGLCVNSTAVLAVSTRNLIASLCIR